MLLLPQFALAAGLFVGVTTAQSNVATYAPRNSRADGISYSVNVPSSTAQSGSGSVYIQMVAPAGTRWLGLGQGDRMAGSNMFVIYKSEDNNVTLSPRLGKGHFEPDTNDAAQLTLLEGTEVSSDGSLTANIRCDSCITWEGGSMDPTSGTSNWIWAVRRGSALTSNDLAAGISEHDDYGQFTLDLTVATSDDSPNPFLEAATAGRTPTSSDTSESFGGEAVSSSHGSSTNGRVRQSHGIVMAIAFLLLFPLASLTVYLPFSRKILFVHAPLQALSTCALIVGAVLGIVLGIRTDEIDEYHQIIGYIIVGCMLLFQPALGIIQHLRHRKIGQRTIFGHIHRWLGRILLLVGVINGGLGLYIADEHAPRWAVIVYSVAAAVVGLFYIAVVSYFGRRQKRKAGSKKDTKF